MPIRQCNVNLRPDNEICFLWQQRNPSLFYSTSDMLLVGDKWRHSYKNKNILNPKLYCALLMMKQNTYKRLLYAFNIAFQQNNAQI